MYFDNLTLLGVVAALAIGGLIVRLMVPEGNDDDRNLLDRDGMTDEGTRFLRS